MIEVRLIKEVLQFIFNEAVTQMYPVSLHFIEA